MKRLITSVILVCVLFTVLFTGINFTTSLKLDLTLSLSIYSENDILVGSGSIDTTSIGMSIDKWPVYGNDGQATQIDRSHSNDIQIETPVIFELTIKLNETEKVFELKDFPQTGYYKGYITCLFNNIHSGNYLLSLGLSVKGTTDQLDFIERNIYVK